MKKQILTPEEFTEFIKSLIEGDPERDYIKMDDAMIELLRKLGYDEAMYIVEDQVRWYA